MKYPSGIAERLITDAAWSACFNLRLAALKEQYKQSVEEEDVSDQLSEASVVYTRERVA